MQCRNSNLMLGNVTSQPTAAGCNVTSCTYGGFVNGTIVATSSKTAKLPEKIKKMRLRCLETKKLTK
ncbi:hypothetical protein Taro_047694, partial [Colocasia esculenta]|nr:hypothetical protein [Colocasia esculenta]